MTLRQVYWCVALCLLTGVTSSALGQHQTTRARRAALAKPGPETFETLSPAIRAALAKVDTVGIPWIDDMESPGLWTSDGFWHWQLQPGKVSVLNPDINPILVSLPDNGALPSAFSGSGVWWFGESSTGTYIGSDFDRTQEPKSGGTSQLPQSGSLISPPINLKGAKNALLRFWSWWEIEGVDSHTFDLMHVEATTDTSGAWTPLGGGVLNPVDNPDGLSYVAYTSAGLGEPGQWIQQVFDLSQYVNNVVFIRFNFSTEDDLYNGFRGWMIDGVSVTGDTIPAPVLASLFPRIASVGQSITLTGGNFANGAQVYVDSYLISPDSTSVQDVGRVVFGVPDAPGTHSIMVVNPNGKQSNLLVRALTISSSFPPIVYSITPDSTDLGVQSLFTLNGDNFVSPARVLIGGLPAISVSVVGPTTITGFVPTGLSPGTYNVEVINPDSLRAVLPLAFRIRGFEVNALGDRQIGHPQPLEIKPPGGTSAFAGGTVYFRPGGLLPYDSLALVSDTAGYRVDFPATVITPRGVEYYIVMRGFTGSILTYPAINPQYTPEVFQVEMPVLPVPLRLVKGSYRMITAPLLLSNPSPLLQLADDFGPYGAGAWRLLRWEQGRYREIPQIAADLEPGYGFWLGTALATSFDLRGATSVPSVLPYSVSVDTGWNQVGNPFAFPVDWSAVGSLNSYTSPPYQYDGIQYRIDGILQPFTAAFVYNFGPGPGVIEFPPIDAQYAGKVGDHEAAGSGEFFLGIAGQVVGTPYADSYNRLGFKQLATDQVDRLDAPKPPAIGKGMELSIMEAGTPFLEDFKSLNEEGQSWFIALRSREIEGPARVTLEQTGTLPPDFDIHVLDLIGENAVPVSGGGFDASLPPDGTWHYYKVIIGTSAFAEKEGQGIPLQPLAFALHQNYPNPFNPETRISYDLGMRSDVALEVYSSLGQHVRTLVRAGQTTGSYTVTWDGRSDAGSPVSSGVYFYRLRAGDFSAVRKLMLIR